MLNKGQFWQLVAVLFLACGIEFISTPLQAQEPVAQVAPPAGSVRPDQRSIVVGPLIKESETASRLPAAAREPTAKPLPINLATALRLAGARAINVAAADASVQVAEAQLARANVLWVPNLNAGAGYYRHDGATQGQSGNYYQNSKEQFFGGMGITARVSTTDAIFAPLAARQVLRSRQIDLQTAQNDALLAAAEAYFNVQQSRGRVAATRDVVDKGLILRGAIEANREVVAKATDLHRARALLATFDDAIASAREQWGLASASLTRVLRLDPAATVEPLEAPNLRVTLIDTEISVYALIPIGLTSRPELASQQALVEASLAQVRQERARPLLPNFILQGSPGDAGPGGYLMGGVFGSNANSIGNPWAARDDVSVGLVWELQNFGFGNRALVRERRGEQQQRQVELGRVQDQVAAEISEAYVQVRSANTRIVASEMGVREAVLAYEGSLKELGQVDRVGDAATVVRRAFEVIDALRSLSQAYDLYFLSINDYNRAQFRLYRALGCPAQILACERASGATVPVDTTRPAQMAPVCAPELCPRP